GCGWPWPAGAPAPATTSSPPSRCTCGPVPRRNSGRPAATRLETPPPGRYTHQRPDLILARTAIMASLRAWSTATAAALVLLAFGAARAPAQEAGPLEFHLTFDKAVHDQPFSGRVYVLLSKGNRG